MEFQKGIHLLYVPTIFCNMGCKYCYLGELTEESIDTGQVINTLNFTLENLLSNGYLPFNLSFHGGEVTTLPSSVLDELFSISAQHYKKYADDIRQLGFKASPVHVKTNMLNFQKHYEVFAKHKVSVSGSVDLPLKLHDKYRRDKKDKSTLDRILNNLKLLTQYPHHKKISCVATREHLQHMDDFIADIKFLHYELGLDMSRFNVMFGFESVENEEKFIQRTPGTEMLTDTEQVEFYQIVKQAFLNTPLENAFRTEWFKEFTPDYCCSAVNCGDKFFLVQMDGDVYSCPRGQSSQYYRYGNVYQDDINEIINNGWQVIERNENQMDVHEDCMQCAYISYCNGGCSFVRQQTGLSKSYTCQLQQALYKDNPERYVPFTPEQTQNYVKQFLLRNNIKKLHTIYPVKSNFVTPELYQDDNDLLNIIEKDNILKALYSENLFFLQVNGTQYWLKSGILKSENDIEILNQNSQILLGVRKDALQLNCHYPVNNYLHIMLLRDTTVVYGDEQRNKQEHIFDYSLYHNSLIQQSTLQDGYYICDISAVIKLHAAAYLAGVRNNVFFTTKSLREYHYEKHRKNAFYHVQAINLPFQNIEFLWM